MVYGWPSVLILAGIIALLFTGCTNIGPKTVPRDRFDYNTAISDSWKEQTLLNMVFFPLVIGRSPCSHTR